MAERLGDWICTASGREFWPMDPRPDEIEIEDIAHSLANLCRFTGHCRKFYSVAQHSVMVSHHCDPADALWGLLHDASEAYLIDLPRPVKRSPGMEAYRAAEVAVMRAVCSRFALGEDMPSSVKRADEVLLATEARDLMPAASVRRWILVEQPLRPAIIPWSPEASRYLFLKRFRQLMEVRHG